jgi:hypothetical protein
MSMSRKFTHLGLDIEIRRLSYPKSTPWAIYIDGKPTGKTSRSELTAEKLARGMVEMRLNFMSADAYKIQNSS